jgi:hypothetical protein
MLNDPTSSLTMMLAAHAAESRARKAAVGQAIRTPAE